MAEKDIMDLHIRLLGDLRFERISKEEIASVRVLGGRAGKSGKDDAAMAKATGVS